MVMTHTYARNQGQRSLSSKVRVETGGRTDKRTDKRRQLHYKQLVPSVRTRLVTTRCHEVAVDRANSTYTQHG